MKSLYHLTRTHYLVLLTLLLSLGSSFIAEAQVSAKGPVSLDKPNLWTEKELIEPAELASILRNKKNPRPVILNIGVVEDIKGAKSLGAASKTENLAKLKEQLKALPKSTMVVIYCGCCPFDKCPNIRPAFTVMKDMGFSKGRLLNIPVNLKQNWISKGYPMLSDR